jgi:hypothetical protein
MKVLLCLLIALLPGLTCLIEVSLVTIERDDAAHGATAVLESIAFRP